MATQRAAGDLRDENAALREQLQALQGGLAELTSVRDASASRIEAAEAGAAAAERRAAEAEAAAEEVQRAADAAVHAEAQRAAELQQRLAQVSALIQLHHVHVWRIRS